MPGRGHRLERFIRGLPLEDQLSARRMNEILNAIESAYPIAGRGIATRSGPGGTAISWIGKAGKGGSAASPLPWDITLVDNATNPSTESDATLYPGTVSDILPSNMFSTATILKANTYWIVLNVTQASGKITALTISYDGTAPAENDVTANAPPLTFKILVGYVLANVGYNVMQRSLSPYANVRYRTAKTPPVSPGESAWDFFYGWSW